MPHSHRTYFGRAAAPAAAAGHYSRALPLLALAVALLTSCSQKQDPAVIAKVGSREFRAADLQQEMERRRATRKPIPGKEALLQEMMEHEALLQRARAAGIDKDPQVAREISNLLIAKLLEQEKTVQPEAITISAEEVRAAYEQNIASYTQPAKVRLAILFCEASESSSAERRAEARSRLNEAISKFKAGPAQSSLTPGFGPIALDYSDDQLTRYRGGDAGWVTTDTFPERYPRVVFETGAALEAGRVSDIIETPKGFFCVMKTDARERTVKPLAQVESTLRHSLLLQKQQQANLQFRRAALAAAGTSVNTQALIATSFPEPAKHIANSNVPRSDAPNSALRVPRSEN